MKHENEHAVKTLGIPVDDADLTTWGNLIRGAILEADDHTPLVHIAPDDSVLSVKFGASFYSDPGPSFCAWTDARVYFPLIYDGRQSIGSAPRNPSDTPLDHQGGN